MSGLQDPAMSKCWTTSRPNIAGFLFYVLIDGFEIFTIDIQWVGEVLNYPANELLRTNIQIAMW